MREEDYQKLSQRALKDDCLTKDELVWLLTAPEIELPPLLNAAYQVRKHYWGKKVRVHILNNAQNGYCPEDCNYCVQGQESKESGIESYGMKSDEEILAEAQKAANSGAYRYCLVFSGHGPSDSRVQHLAELIQEIKRRHKIEVCVSPGILKEGQAEVLKAAGLDRLNHNLNTTEARYPSICTTHTYKDRINTLNMARAAGLELCSGFITGMGEGPQGVAELLSELGRQQAKSIPINFLVSIDGTPIGKPETLSPDYCLRVLCAARFSNPRAEIRAAAGRERHLRSLEAMALYPANSVFMEGYLNVMGESSFNTLRMIMDLGFEIDCEEALSPDILESLANNTSPIELKSTQELHPSCR